MVARTLILIAMNVAKAETLVQTFRVIVVAVYKPAKSILRALLFKLPAVNLGFIHVGIGFDPAQTAVWVRYAA